MAVIETVHRLPPDNRALRNTRLTSAWSGYQELGEAGRGADQQLEPEPGVGQAGQEKSDFITIAPRAQDPLTLVQGYAEMLTDGAPRSWVARPDSVVAGINQGDRSLRALIETYRVALIDPRC